MLDTSVVISAALRRGSTPDRAIRMARDRGKIALSQAVIAEWGEVLRRPRFRAAITEAGARDIVDVLRSDALWFEPTASIRECRDAGDDKYLELALVAQADVIVSGDADLLVMDPWRGIRILTPAAFLAFCAGLP